MMQPARSVQAKHTLSIAVGAEKEENICGTFRRKSCVRAHEAQVVKDFHLSK